MLDVSSIKRFDTPFARATPPRQKELLDAVAYRHSTSDSFLSPGIEFFAFLRNLVLDAFFTNRIGSPCLYRLPRTPARQAFFFQCVAARSLTRVTVR